tara:strand:+ start:267 stop:383 length:117 start_codon:yes stop_codon:yes gene_type:complete
MNKKNIKNNSISSIFVKNGIFYYYAFFWIVLIGYLFLK